MWTREPLRQGETCFLNSEMPKKIHACPNVNKWIERHLRVPYYSPPLFPTIANHCSLHYYLSPQAGLREMRRKLRSTFSALNLLVAIKTFKASRMSIGWYHSIVWRHLFNRLPWLWLLFFFWHFSEISRASVAVQCDLIPGKNFSLLHILNWQRTEKKVAVLEINIVLFFVVVLQIQTLFKRGRVI